MNNLNIFDAYSLALQEDKNSIYSKIGINVVLYDKKFSRKSIQWCDYSVPSHLYIAIDKLSNDNLVNDINITKEPSIQVNEDVEHIDYKLYNIGDKIYAISMNSDIIRSYFPGQIFLQLSENGKEIIYNYIDIVPNSYRGSVLTNTNQNFEMELDQKTNLELSKKYGFSVNPSLLLQQYEHHPNPEIAFIGKELYHYIKETIQYRIRFPLDALAKLQLFEVNTQDIYKFKNENLVDDFPTPPYHNNNENINYNLSNSNNDSDEKLSVNRNKRRFDEIDDDTYSMGHNSFSKIFKHFNSMEEEEEEVNGDNVNETYAQNNHFNFNSVKKRSKTQNMTYVLVFEWKYPPETFQKIPLWNNRLKRKAYSCQDWTTNESASNSSRNFIFGTKACLTDIYYSILKRAPRLMKPIETNNLIFQPNIIKHRVFPKPHLKKVYPTSTNIFDKKFLQAQTIQTLRQIVIEHDLYDEIDTDLGSESIVRDLLLYDVKTHHNDEDEDETNSINDFYNNNIMNTSSFSSNPLLQNKNSYYHFFNNMDDQKIQSLFTIPDTTFKVLQENGFDFEQRIPYGYFKIKLEKYPLCFQNFLWNHLQQPEILEDYLNELIPVEIQWNYQIPEFLISVIEDGKNVQSTLKVSTFIQKNTNPEIYWCFCQRRMLTTDYYHHCEKCGVCYDMNYWHCSSCQKCSLGQNVGVCNFCGKARYSIH